MRSVILAKCFFILPALILGASIISCSKPPVGTVVTISLPKKTYKMYEPIELGYEWINYKNTPDSIQISFSSPYFIKHYITDEKGNHFGNNKMRPPDMSPFYIVAQADTLRKTTTLNHFGKRYTDSPTEAYFHNYSYFPPGKYKLYAVFEEQGGGKKFEKPIITNEVEFEVVELENNDSVILELAKKEKYDEALHLYPDNYFDEYLMFFEALKYNLEFMKAGEDNDRYKDTSMLPVKYNAFFDKYPNSVHILSDMFINRYLAVCNKNYDQVRNKMNELLNKYPNTLIAVAINQIIKSEKLTGKLIYIFGINNKKGVSEEVKPAPLKVK